MKVDHQIRAATIADAEALLEIYQPVVLEQGTCFELEPPTESAFANRIERVGAVDPWLVLERNDQIAGYAYATTYRVRPAYATTRETSVYVHPDHQRAGVGRRLMLALLEELRSRGTRMAIAIIALPNDASVSMHETLGFHRAGTVHNVARKFDRWHDEGIWELDLAAD